MHNSKLWLGALCASTMLSGTAQAEEKIVLDPVIVTTTKDTSKLNQKTEVGSSLGLTPKETPATVNIVTQDEMQTQGLSDLIEVYNAIPGVMSGNNPGEPGMLSMRGFGRSSTGYLMDGVRTIDPVLMVRNYDSYHFERVEALKGPASVVSGTGALAGSINVVTRKPTLGEASREAFVSYGSYDSFRVGGSVNQPINDKTAVNATLTYGQTGGYIDDTDSEKLGFTSGIVTQATERLKLSASLDYFQDRFETAYYGTPLIPLASAQDPSGEVSSANGYVLDKAIKYNNYNATDGLMKSSSIWLRTNAEYALSDSWTVNNELSYFSADRSWEDVDYYTFDVNTGLLNRDATIITHDHQFWADRFTIANDSTLAGKRNRFTAGLEYIATDFSSKRRFGTTTAVDPFNPVRGVMPTVNNVNYYYLQNYDSKVETFAVFAEDAFNLTPNWLTVVGLRYEDIDLTRDVANLVASTTSTFKRNYDSLSWRVGTVYDVNENVSLFAQYNQATMPLATLLLSNSSNSSFDLSTGTSVEVGTKSSFWDNRGVITVSLFQIEQDDILTRDPNNPALTVQGGSQRSRGVEFDVTLDVTEQWTVGANAAFQKSEYTDLLDGGGKSLKGNRPYNVPSRTFNLNTAYTLESIPLTIGGGVRHAGSFYTNTANTIEVAGHTLFDASLAYQVGNGTLTLRGKNLTDEFYADWSGYSSTQVYVGEPRTFEMTYNLTF